jgi:hypothetical protein
LSYQPPQNSTIYRTQKVQSIKEKELNAVHRSQCYLSYAPSLKKVISPSFKRYTPYTDLKKKKEYLYL